MAAGHKQVQEGRDKSLQLQAGRDINVQGITAQEARDIARNELNGVRSEIDLTANAVAVKRMESLNERLLDVLSNQSQLLNAFADPDFRYSLLDAQRAAASNDDGHVEELLVGLLKKRAEEGGHPKSRLATSYAIKAADKLSKEALDGLTVLWVLTWIVPSLEQGTAEEKARIVEALYLGLVELALPTDVNWQLDLDVLGLVRQDSTGIVSRTSFKDLMKAKCGLDGADNVVDSQVENILAKSSTFSKFREWWDRQPSSVFTSAGDAIGYVNAKQHVEFGGPSNLEELFTLRTNRTESQ